MAQTIHGKTELFTHFLGAALPPEVAGVAENSGTAAIKVGIEGGVAEITTGTTDGNRAHLSAGLNMKAASGSLVMEARVKCVTAITTRALFIGFTDSVAQENPIELGASDAITSTATDAVGFVYDTDAATDKWFAVGVKTNIDTALLAVNVKGAQQAPVADKWQTFRVEVNADGHAVFSFGQEGEGLQEIGRIANAVAPGVLLTPHVGIEARTTAAQTAYVDFLGACGATA